MAGMAGNGGGGGSGCLKLNIVDYVLFMASVPVGVGGCDRRADCRSYTARQSGWWVVDTIGVSFRTAIGAVCGVRCASAESHEFVCANVDEYRAGVKLQPRVAECLSLERWQTRSLDLVLFCTSP